MKLYCRKEHDSVLLINLSSKTITTEKLILFLFILQKPRNFNKDNKKIKKQKIKLGLTFFNNHRLIIRLENQAQRLQTIFNSICRENLFKYHA